MVGNITQELHLVLKVRGHVRHRSIRRCCQVVRKPANVQLQVVSFPQHPPIALTVCFLCIPAETSVTHLAT